MSPHQTAQGRAAVPRPKGRNDYTFICPRCDIILSDGAAYEFCPACNAPVDWVDLTLPVWACPTCDAMINRDLEGPVWCDACGRGMNAIRPWQRPPPPKHAPEGSTLLARVRSSLATPVGLAVLATASLLPALSLALDPQFRWLGIAQLLPILIVPLIIGGSILSHIPAIVEELRRLTRDSRARVIHGIEHTAVIVLLRRGYPVKGGQTENGYFKLWLKSDDRNGKHPGTYGTTAAVRSACVKALRLVRQRKWSVAIQARCGTTWLVLFLLASLAAFAAVALGLFTALTPLSLLIWTGGFLVTLVVGSRPIGYFIQRTMTVAVDFRHATVQRILRRVESNGDICYYVHLDVVL